jgi:hypothetical protein
MSKEKPPKYNPSLFAPENPKPGDEGYIEKGFKLRDDGYLEDEKGNIYDINFNLIKEAPSPGLLLARKQYPNLSDQQLSSLAAFYNRQLKLKEKKERKEKKEKKRKSN